MNFLHDLCYSIMYYVGYLEILMNKILRVFMISNPTEETVYLVNTNSMEVEIIEDLNSDIAMDYHFGIVETTRNDKLCHYIFDELDTDNIPGLFSNSIECPIFSIDVIYQNNKYAIDITNINYFFEDNKLFFREHIIYIMNKYHSINLDNNSKYEVTFIDHQCDLMTMSCEEHILLKPIDDKMYCIKNSK